MVTYLRQALKEEVTDVRDGRPCLRARVFDKRREIPTHLATEGGLGKQQGLQALPWSSTHVSARQGPRRHTRTHSDNANVNRGLDSIEPDEPPVPHPTRDSQHVSDPSQSSPHR